MSLYEFGQIFGIIVAIIGFFTYIPRKRGTILLMKASTDTLGVIQQIIIGAYTGAGITAIAVLRGLVFFNRGRKKWADNKFWLWFFVIVIGLTPIFTWAGPASLLPMAGSVIMVFGFYNMNPHYTRIIALLGHGLWLIYTIVVFNIGAIIQNAVYITAAIVGLIMDNRIKNKEEATQPEEKEEEAL